MFRTLLTNRVARLIILAGVNLLSIINQIIPKKNNKVLFFDSTGSTFSDNSRALFDYMWSNGYNRRMKLIVCIPNKNQYLNFNDKNIKVVSLLSGVFSYITSKYVFYSYGGMRIKPSRNQVVINQAHGTPLKRIDKAGRDSMTRKESLYCFTNLLSTSDAFSSIMANSYDCDESVVMVAGQTRNDDLFSKKDVFSLLGISRESYVKTILWMPTFRVSYDHRYENISPDVQLGETMLPLVDTFEKLDLLNDFLRRNKMFMALKIHNYSVYKNFDYSNIKLYVNLDFEKIGVRLYEFVKEFDCLLTDYSSIFFDYLLLDRPIGFTIDDFESYASTRGFSVEDPLRMMPGSHIKTIDSLYSFFNDVLENKDSYKTDRQRVRDISNKYQDNENCKRLLKMCGLPSLDIKEEGN